MSDMIMARDTIEAPARFRRFLFDGETSDLLDADDFEQASTLYNALIADDWRVMSVASLPYRGAWDCYGLGSPESRARYRDCEMLTYRIVLASPRFERPHV